MRRLQSPCCDRSNQPARVERPVTRSGADARAELRAGLSRLRVALESPQIHEQLFGRLIPNLPVLFQRFVDNPTELGGTFGFSPVADSGALLRSASKTTAEVLPLKGNVPVVISYNTTPKENRSVRASSSSPRACSGDM